MVEVHPHLPAVSQAFGVVVKWKFPRTHPRDQLELTKAGEGEAVVSVLYTMGHMAAQLLFNTLAFPSSTLNANQCPPSFICAAGRDPFFRAQWSYGKRSSCGGHPQAHTRTEVPFVLHLKPSSISTLSL